jgi:hypothetical protein
MLGVDMSNEIIFFTQIASIITFIVSLFVIYHLLVSQKDATIQLLKEKISDLDGKLAEARDSSPDNLSERLSKRIQIYEAELARLKEDKNSDKYWIDKIEERLKIAREESIKLEAVNKKIENIQNEMECLRSEVTIDEDYIKEIYGYLDNEIMDHLNKTKKAFTVNELSNILNTDPFLINLRLKQLIIHDRIKKIIEAPDTIKFEMIFRS